MRHPDGAFVTRAADLLFTAAPNSLLSRATGAAKSTVRSWRRAHRRPPLHVLRLLSTELQRRGAECFSVQRELDILVAKRMGEGPRRRGFFVVDPLTGQNRQNRLGRPRRGAPRMAEPPVPSRPGLHYGEKRHAKRPRTLRAAAPPELTIDEVRDLRERAMVEAAEERAKCHALIRETQGCSRAWLLCNETSQCG